MSLRDSPLASLRGVIAHADAIAMGADPVQQAACAARAAREQQDPATLPLLLQGMHGQQAFAHEQQALDEQVADGDGMG